MLKICLLWLQVIEHFYEIYLLGCIDMYIKNISETKSSTFMEKFFLWNQRKISLFLFLFSCLLLPIAIYNVWTLLVVGILKKISRDGNPLSNYLSVQENLLFDAKVSYSKVNKVRGHLLSKQAILEIGLIIVLITTTLLS